ncbi:unnamed protein product [Amoebophrya sp. A120]|nr:unnamed protein product [Amoebophrya sp. A120]|eukprot:GSA120T00018797001.1
MFYVSGLFLQLQLLLFDSSFLQRNSPVHVVHAQPGGSRKPVIDHRQPMQLESEKIRLRLEAEKRRQEEEAEMGPRQLPKSLQFDTSVVQDIKRSLKVLSNDLLVIIDLLDQKLGLRPEDSEKIDETTLARRKAEDLERQKIEKGYVPGNICRTHVGKDIGTSIVHAGAKILLLSKRPDSTEGDRWEVNIVGTTRRVSFHELEIQCEPKPVTRADSNLDPEEVRWLQEWNQYGWWIYVRQGLYFLGFFLDMALWTSMQLFLDSAAAKKRRRKIFQDASLGQAAVVSAASPTLSSSSSQALGSGPGAGSGSSSSRGVDHHQPPVSGDRKSRRQRSRWEILMQEDVLAQLVDEYVWKLALSFVIAVALRLPQYLLDTGGVAYSMLLNLIITLRALAAVTFFIGDNLVMPA